MIRLAELWKWLMIEQKLEPEPIEIVTSLLLEQNYGAKPVPAIDLDAKSDLDVSDLDAYQNYLKLVNIIL